MMTVTAVYTACDHFREEWWRWWWCGLRRECQDRWWKWQWQWRWRLWWWRRRRFARSRGGRGRNYLWRYRQEPSSSQHVSEKKGIENNWRSLSEKKEKEWEKYKRKVGHWSEKRVSKCPIQGWWLRPCLYDMQHEVIAEVLDNKGTFEQQISHREYPVER